MKTNYTNSFDADHNKAIEYTYDAIQTVLGSNPDITPEGFIEALNDQFPDIDAQFAGDYETDDEEVVTVYSSSLIGSDILYLNTINGKLVLGDEFLYSMGGGDEDADWERWKFGIDEKTGKIIFFPAY